MNSLSLSAAGPAERRLPALLATLLLHAALVLGWQMTRTQAPAQEDPEEALMQWLRLPPLAVTQAPSVRPVQASEPSTRAPARAKNAATSRPPRATLASRPVAPDASTAATPTPAETVADPLPTVETPAPPSAAAILENARRSAGSIERALRKESKPTIVAPPDSPQIRMREGMEQARALAPPRLWEAPKVEELVNNTGDGARRTRVITGNGTYCITERSPATSIDMIEKHGKQRFTSCPQHETPAKRQVWRTARD